MSKKKIIEYKRNSDGKETPKYLTEFEIRALISNALVFLKEPVHIAGGSIIAGNPNGTGLKLGKDGIMPGSDPSIQGWGNTMTFSAVDADTVQWSAGTITLTDGTIYNIEAGNTGNMSALTYIYFDINISATVLQKTTTQATAVGRGRILVAVAQNNAASEATFQVFGGSGGILIKADNIAANTITANEIAANTITASQLSVAQLSAISANLGTVTAGTLIGNTIKTATPGAGVGSSVVINGGSNEMIHFYYDAIETGTIRGYTTEGSEVTYIRIEAASGRNLRFKNSMIECDGDFVPAGNETYSCGRADAKWDEVRADKFWQSSNTNGSRMVHDFAYIELGLISESFLKKVQRKNKNMQMANGYMEGLELPFKKGTVLKWTDNGLAESNEENDFAIAVANENGLPIVLGAEPVRVTGKAKIGDYIIPSNKNGCAMAVDFKYAQGKEIIGRCLKNKKDTKERLINVMIKF